MLISPRPLSVFAAVFACAWMPAGAAQATSAVETARAHERDMETLVAADESQRLPESPLAIAGPLAMSDPFQIQLGGVDREALDDAALLELSLDVAPE